ncbi:hypothetical protein LTR36_010511 [Oleoguttula mirabilis]|uniref:Uncharacterized protein n=1 Tax=Oleoguttula mirabilis TaxID=1507867 RepID=A0AAV9J418_9PEZI|nr:hypothetical protein LTR36_010511 [Oleoguttula mirabilis]
MATRSVLSNDDLLSNIVAFSDTSVISYARLVSRGFEAAASPYLFSTLRLGLRKRYFRRLKRVAADEKFAKGGREIVWDTATYACGARPYDSTDVSYLWYYSGASPDEISTHCQSERDAALARLKALDKDEMAIVADFSGLAVQLHESLRCFTGLKGVTFTTWSSANRAFFDRDSKRMSPPYRTLAGSPRNVQTQSAAFSVPLGALSHTSAIRSEVVQASTS